MNLQIRERNKVLALSKEISRKESVLHALQAALEQVRGMVVMMMLELWMMILVLVVDGNGGDDDDDDVDIDYMC